MEGCAQIALKVRTTGAQFRLVIEWLLDVIMQTQYKVIRTDYRLYSVFGRNLR